MKRTTKVGVVHGWKYFRERTQKFTWFNVNVGGPFSTNQHLNVSELNTRPQPVMNGRMDQSAMQQQQHHFTTSTSYAAASAQQRHGPCRGPCGRRACPRPGEGQLGPQAPGATCGTNTAARVNATQRLGSNWWDEQFHDTTTIRWSRVQQIRRRGMENKCNNNFSCDNCAVILLLERGRYR